MMTKTVTLASTMASAKQDQLQVDNNGTNDNYTGIYKSCTPLFHV